MRALARRISQPPADATAQRPESGLVPIFAPGTVIADKYRLGRLVGSGGMASVWAAVNTLTERPCAIKFLLPDMARTHEAKARFLMEAKASARIDHPNVIDVIDVGQTESGTLFLVMELLSGQSLDQAMRLGPQTMLTRDFVVVMRDVARAMAAAHRRGVIHRDLKPSNIFLHADRNGTIQPKVLDFGVSKFMGDKTHGALTIAGTVLGSPMYMSPEQARGVSDIDGRTDIFAFGAILFEGLCGFRSYDGTNINALIVAIATREPADIDAHAPSVSPRLRALVKHCLVVDLDARAREFETIAHELDAIALELGTSSSRLPVPAISEPAPMASGGIQNGRSSSMPPPSRPSGADLAPPTMSGIQVSHVGSAHPSSSIPPAMPQAHRGPARTLTVVGAVALVVGAIAGAATYGKRSPQDDTRARTTQARADARPRHERADQPTTRLAREGAKAPNVSIDALPVVARSAPTTTAIKGKGKLQVSANGDGCQIFVDGLAKGSTPLRLDLTAGPHELRCDPARGVPVATTVRVSPAHTTKHRFDLD